MYGCCGLGVSHAYMGEVGGGGGQLMDGCAGLGGAQLSTWVWWAEGAVECTGVQRWGAQLNRWAWWAGGAQDLTTSYPPSLVRFRSIPTICFPWVRFGNDQQCLISGQAWFRFGTDA